MEGIEEEVKEGKAVVGLITSSFNGKAFIWSSVLGKGLLLFRFDQKIRHGEWIKFIPSYVLLIKLDWFEFVRF